MGGDAMRAAAAIGPFIAASFLIVASCFVEGCGIAQDEGELVLLHVLWRHGDRSPTGTYKNDPHQESEWPRGFGQLTARGMIQQMELGQRLRREYVERRKFLKPQYNAKEVYVRSTDTDRTLASAISNFIGFYTDARADVDYPKELPPGMAWPGHYIPVAVHSHARIQNDHWGNPDADCPRQAAIRELWKETPEYQKLVTEQKPLLDRLTNWTGQNIGLVEMVMLSDVFKIQRLWNYSLPSWATPDVIKQINDVKDVMWNWMFGLGMAPYKGLDFHMELTKIRGGTMLWTILHNIQSKITCLSQAEAAKTPEKGVKNALRSVRLEATNPEPPMKVDPNCAEALGRKYFAYSAVSYSGETSAWGEDHSVQHDSSISALLSAMGLEKTSFESETGLGYPNYASAVGFELYKGGVESDDNYYIRVFYWPFNATSVDLTGLIPGCERTQCNYHTFFNITSSYLPPDGTGMVSHCNNTVLFPNIEPGNHTATLSGFKKELALNDLGKDAPPAPSSRRGSSQERGAKG